MTLARCTLVAAFVVCSRAALLAEVAVIRGTVTAGRQAAPIA